MTNPQEALEWALNQKEKEDWSDWQTKHTKEEILSALQLIKDICSEGGACELCPFYDVNQTGVKCKFLKQQLPKEWNINNPTEIWRAFK